MDRAPRYSRFIRIVTAIFGIAGLAEGVIMLVELWTSWSQLTDIRTMYVLAMLGGLLIGPLFLYVSWRGNVPQWLERANESPPPGLGGPPD
jgi:cytochrome bd-type quinol oxidase subunit 1